MGGGACENLQKRIVLARVVLEDCDLYHRILIVKAQTDCVVYHLY
jgi:hypothetical protein